MKKTTQIALGGMMCALGVVTLLLTVFPYATYALPAIASVFLFPVIIECGKPAGMVVYGATALLALFVTPDIEAKMLYVLFFGYYPLIKALTESIRNRVAEWVIKLVVFNAAVIAVYVALKALGLPLDDFYIPGINLSLQTVMWLFLLAGNVVFVLYDIALTRALPFYFSRIQPMIRRILK